MNTDTKWNILFIEDEQSIFDLNTNLFTTLFNKADITTGRKESLKLFDDNSYDIVICDLSVKPEEIAFMKQLKDKKPEQTIFVLVQEKDTDKVYGFADLGINAFILSPEQLSQALETIAEFNPYEKS